MSLIQVTMFSISANFFPDNKEAMIGYTEAAIGIGFVVGPFIGSILYMIGGYKFIFYAYGFFFLLISITIRFMFDSYIDGPSPQLKETESLEQKVVKEIQEGDDNYMEVDKNITNPVSLWELLGHARYFFAALSGSLSYFMYCFMEPILANRLKHYNLSQF